MACFEEDSGRVTKNDVGHEFETSPRVTVRCAADVNSNPISSRVIPIYI